MYGYIRSYVHNDGQIAVLVELGCKDSFTARTPEFQELSRELAMHIAAMDPIWRDPSELDSKLWKSEVERQLPFLQRLEVGEAQARLQLLRETYERDHCLLRQPYVKDAQVTIGDMLSEASRKLGVPIHVVRFIRYRVNA